MYFRMKALEERITELEQKMAALEAQAQERPVVTHAGAITVTAADVEHIKNQLVADLQRGSERMRMKTRLIPL